MDVFEHGNFYLKEPDSAFLNTSGRRAKFRDAYQQEYADKVPAPFDSDGIRRAIMELDAEFNRVTAISCGRLQGKCKKERGDRQTALGNLVNKYKEYLNDALTTEADVKKQEQADVTSGAVVPITMTNAPVGTTVTRIPPSGNGSERTLPPIIPPIIPTIPTPMPFYQPNYGPSADIGYDTGAPAPASFMGITMDGNTLIKGAILLGSAIAIIALLRRKHNVA